MSRYERSPAYPFKDQRVYGRVSALQLFDEIFETAKQMSNDSDRLLVRPKRACHLLDCGITHLYELIAKGEITSLLDGRSRKITVDSIHRYIAKQLATAAAKHSGAAAQPRSAHTRAIPADRRRGRPCKNSDTELVP
jgi:excisionase family DNA binding protein